ncbi:MAG TPA: YceI family protein [Terriglobales bacterium]|nr:YceI family protein [Terriglobales bacterium]
MRKTFCSIVLGPIGLLVATATLVAAQQAAPPVSRELLLQLDPAGSGAEITLAGNLHTVKGSFLLKRGVIHFDPATGKASGEIAFDATSGKTGNSSRDNKMHKDVIESERYPEIVFRPDRADGTLATSGVSALQVHGMFTMHGAEHEVTFPVEVTFAGSAWSAQASFQVPYVRWGMKNPSVLFLRVDDLVQVRFHASGNTTP